MGMVHNTTVISLWYYMQCHEYSIFTSQNPKLEGRNGDDINITGLREIFRDTSLSTHLMFTWGHVHENGANIGLSSMEKYKHAHTTHWPIFMWIVKMFQSIPIIVMIFSIFSCRINLGPLHVDILKGLRTLRNWLIYGIWSIVDELEYWPSIL